MTLTQLAHEVVHLLSPSGKGLAPVLEEGLAHTYEGEVSDRFILNMRYAEPNYDYAAKKLKELLAIEQDAVRMIRRFNPTFHIWTPEIIKHIIPSVPSQLAIDLCEYRLMR